MDHGVAQTLLFIKFELNYAHLTRVEVDEVFWFRVLHIAKFHPLMIQCQVGCACPTPWCGMHISFFYISFLQYLTSTPYQVLFVSLLSCLQFSALASTLTWLLRSSGLLTTRGCLEEVLALVRPGRRWCCYLSYNTSSSSSFLGWMLLFCLFDYLLRIWIVFPLIIVKKVALDVVVQIFR